MKKAAVFLSIIVLVCIQGFSQNFNFLIHKSEFGFHNSETREYLNSQYQMEL